MKNCLLVLVVLACVQSLTGKHHEASLKEAGDAGEILGDAASSYDEFQPALIPFDGKSVGWRRRGKSVRWQKQAQPSLSQWAPWDNEDSLLKNEEGSLQTEGKSVGWRRRGKSVRWQKKAQPSLLQWAPWDNEDSLLKNEEGSLQTEPKGLPLEKKGKSVGWRRRGKSVRWQKKAQPSLLQWAPWDNEDSLLKNEEGSLQTEGKSVGWRRRGKSLGWRKVDKSSWPWLKSEKNSVSSSSRKEKSTKWQPEEKLLGWRNGGSVNGWESGKSSDREDLVGGTKKGKSAEWQPEGKLLGWRNGGSVNGWESGESSDLVGGTKKGKSTWSLSATGRSGLSSLHRPDPANWQRSGKKTNWRNQAASKIIPATLPAEQLIHSISEEDLAISPRTGKSQSVKGSKPRSETLKKPQLGRKGEITYVKEKKFTWPGEVNKRQDKNIPSRIA